MTNNVSSSEHALAELNSSYFVAKEGGETLVYESSEDLWADPMRPRKWLQPYSFEAFRRWESNKLVEDRAIIERRGDWWLRNPLRREFRNIRLLPYGPTPDGVFNLWHGFVEEPKKGDWSRLHRFLKNVVCGGSAAMCDWLTFWMANAVQRPAEHGSTGLYLRGGSGDLSLEDPEPAKNQP